MRKAKPNSRAAPLGLAGAIVVTFAFAAPAYAAGTGMPWEQPLQQVLDSLTGPVARAAAIVGIIISGMAILFSEGGGGIRKLAFVGLGIAVMFGAVSFFLNFFGFAGGATI